MSLPLVVISKPVVSYLRIRRMVHPYEVEHHDTYEKNQYPPQPHSGVVTVVTTSIPSETEPTTTLPPPRQQIHVENPVDQSTSSFPVDTIFNSAVPRKDKSYASQEVVFDTVGIKLLDDLMDGYNSSLMCFGPEGSGKTYTLFGPKAIDGSPRYQSPQTQDSCQDFVNSCFNESQQQ